MFLGKPLQLLPSFFLFLQSQQGKESEIVVEFGKQRIFPGRSQPEIRDELYLAKIKSGANKTGQLGY